MSAQREREDPRRGDEAAYGNERIAERAKELRFHARVPMLCECDDDACRQLFPIALEEFDAARRARERLTVPGHGVEGGTVSRRTRDYWAHR